MNETHVQAKLTISGSLECRDADGNLLKTIKLHTTVPLTSKQPPPHAAKKQDFPLSGYEDTTP